MHMHYEQFNGLKSSQNAINRISSRVNFKIFLGGMPPDLLRMSMYAIYIRIMLCTLSTYTIIMQIQAN